MRNLLSDTVDRRDYDLREASEVINNNASESITNNSSELITNNSIDPINDCPATSEAQLGHGKHSSRLVAT